MNAKSPKILKERMELGQDGYIHLHQMIQWPNGSVEHKDINFYVRSEKELLRMTNRAEW